MVDLFLKSKKADEMQILQLYTEIIKDVFERDQNQKLGKTGRFLKMQNYALVTVDLSS